MSGASRPKLRALERFVLPTADGEFLVLRDPLGVSEMQKLERALEPVLDALDGTKTVAQIRQSLSMVHDLHLEPEDFALFIEQLDRDGMLEGPTFLDLRARAVSRFEEDDLRASVAAGVLFPADPSALMDALGRCLPDAPDRIVRDGRARALLTPHHDFDLAAPLLDACVTQLPHADDLDLVVLLGTDHAPGMRPFAVTDKDYDTPLGPVPTHYELADRVFTAQPETQIEQLRHRGAHSLEFPAVMLRYLYGDACPRVLPILCGRAGFAGAQTHDARTALLDAITAHVDGSRVLWWASAELSHVGAAYGQTVSGDVKRLRAVAEQQDLRCVGHLLAGRQDDLVRLLERAPASLRPSGAAVLEFLLQALGPSATATEARYVPAQVRAPEDPNLIGWAGLAGARFPHLC